MDANKWSDYFQRTKSNEGFKEAASSLVDGLFREMKSRMEQAKPWDNPEDIAQEVNEMYQDISSQHAELREDGFSDLLKEEAPELGALLN